MDWKLKPLPYAYDALAPHIGADTVETHYEKHHRGYLEKLQQLLDGRDVAGVSLVDLVLEESGDIFNNAAQVWNHDFYWESLRPPALGKNTLRRGPLGDWITSSFDSIDGLRQRLTEAATKHFGSGYAWLVLRPRDGRLDVVALSDAHNPLRDGHVPLLCIDVWEHAYYLDRRNHRDAYVRAVVDELLCWETADERLRAAL